MRDEVELLDGIIRGDRSAFEEWLARNGLAERIRVYLRRHMGPHVREYEGSEDWMQDVWVEILRSVGRARPKTLAALEAWVFGLVSKVVDVRTRNKFRQQRDPRRKQSLEERDDRLLQSLRKLVETRTPSRVVQEDELRELMVRALESLDAESAYLVEEHLLEGRPLTTIAEERGLSRAEARSKFAKGRVRFLRCLHLDLGATEGG